MNDFYEELKRLSKSRGLTVDELLKKSIGKNLHTFQGWKQRKTLPRADEIYAISTVLEVSVEHFFSDEAKEFLPENYKQIVRNLDDLSEEEIEILSKMTKEQLKQVCKMYKSIADK